MDRFSFANSGSPMQIVKFIKNRPMGIGGEQHSGWLPAGASLPLPTPIRDILMNLEIQFDGSGYLLCYLAADGTVYGDTWHETLTEAEEVAERKFGIASTEWRLN